MWQTVVASLIVAAAAGWIAWTLFLPRSWRAAVLSRRHRGASPPDACACERDKG
jgi:hypothetical protein